MTAPKLYTVRAAAELFHRHPHTIRRWIEEGEIIKEFFRIAGRLYIPCEEVERVLKERAKKNIP